MKTVIATGPRRAILGSMGIVLCLCLSRPAWAASGPAGPASSALEQLQAAEASLRESQQSAAAVPVEWPHAQDLNTANEKFMAWQVAMLKERQEIARKQARLLHDRMKVPPPPPTGEPDSRPAMTRLDLSLPLPTDAQLSLSAGEPSVSFNVTAQAQVLSFAGASYKAGATYSAKDNKWLVADAADFKAGFETGPVEVTGSYQFYASDWSSSGPAENPAKGAVSVEADLYQIKGAIGYNTQNELSVAAGYNFIKTPKALSSLAEVSVGVEAEVSAPVVVHGVTRGKRTLSSAIRDYSVKLAKLLTEPVDCPHCSAEGQLDCPTCDNTRTITCTNCKGELRFTCKTCGGGGLLTCPTCDGKCSVSCSSCSGTGRQRCYTCSGSGQVTTYESETRSHQELVIDAIGFDEAGQPIYDRHYETRYTTVQVPVSQTCASCGGTGDGGECGTCEGTGRVDCRTCAANGMVQCRRCKGTGMVDCRTCRGSGKITCPDCHGKEIRCPLCKGKKQLGK